MTDIINALELTGIGLGTVFAVLVLFYFGIEVLTRVFKNKD